LHRAGKFRIAAIKTRTPVPSVTRRSSILPIPPILPSADVPRSHASFTHADISRDTQLCLDEAARLAFPDGTVSARTLRAESARGKLVIFRIGKKFYTTLAEIDRMLEKCPALPKAHISISGDGQAGFLPSSSGMDAMKSAQLKQAAAHGSLSLMTRNADA
jgi:hypothetical protein